MSALEKALRDTPPASVAALPEAAQAALAAQIKDARRRQHELTNEAVEKAIKGVPLPVRGVVRKAIRG